MALGKLYIGRKVRELRESARATQSAFAERLGISTSYLNQIENNQRPVSAAVVLALAERFGLDIAELSHGEGERLLAALREALADPVFAGAAPTAQDLRLVAQNAPQIAHAIIACHQAYRRNSEQLASIDAALGGGGAAELTPYEEVRDFFHFLDNYVHELDLAAERLAGELDLTNADTALAQHLERRHRITLKRASPNEDTLRRFDAERRELWLGAYTPASTRNFQMAFQIAGLENDTAMNDIIARAEFRNPESAEICRIGLCNYFAGALLLPYQTFLASARELRHDLELLSVRFGASLEQVAHRLSTLQRPGLKGVPVFFARIDRAGNITKRHSAAKLQFARYGAACPLWNVHQAFEAPGRIIRQLAETPDGARYLCAATEIVKGSAGFAAPRQRYAIALGCEVSFARDFVYADGLDLGHREAFDPIGISCRICERPNCLQRAEPPLKSHLKVDRNHRATLPYAVK